MKEEKWEGGSLKNSGEWLKYGRDTPTSVARREMKL